MNGSKIILDMDNLLVILLLVASASGGSIPKGIRIYYISDSKYNVL